MVVEFFEEAPFLDVAVALGVGEAGLHHLLGEAVHAGLQGGLEPRPAFAGQQGAAVAGVEDGLLEGRHGELGIGN